jgi:hypothetical protein
MKDKNNQQNGNRETIGKANKSKQHLLKRWKTWQTSGKMDCYAQDSLSPPANVLVYMAKRGSIFR